jgi:hypothetical protein
MARSWSARKLFAHLAAGVPVKQRRSVVAKGGPAPRAGRENTSCFVQASTKKMHFIGSFRISSNRYLPHSNRQLEQ